MMRALASLVFLFVAGCGATFSPGFGFTHGIVAGSTAATPDRADALAHYLAAIMYQRDGRYEQYIEELRKASELAPGSSTILSRLGEAYMRMQEYDKARETYEKAVREAPDDAVLWVWLGAAYQQLDRHDDAVNAFEKAIGLAPDNPLGYQALIEAESRSNDYVATVELYRRLIELRPDSAELYLQLGASLARVRDTEGARDAFRTALALKPNLHRARFALAYVLLDLEQPEESARQFERYLDDNPTDTDAREGLAGALARLGRFDEALEQLDRVIAEGPDEPVHQIERMYLLVRAGQPREAAAASPPIEAPFLGTVLRALARRQTGEPYLPLLESLDDAEGDLSAEGRDFLSELLSLFGNKETGQFLIDALQEFRSEGVPSKAVDFFLGRTYLVLERYAEAAEVLAGAARRHPLDKWLQYETAGAYEQLDNFPEAEKYLRACLALDPEDAEVMNFLGYLYAEENVKLDEAEDLLNKALQADPENPFYLDSLGWIYYRKGKADKAIELIRKAIMNMDSDDAVLRDHLGDAYLLDGQPEKALAEWKRARRLDPKLEGVQEKIDRHEKGQ